MIKNLVPDRQIYRRRNREGEADRGKERKSAIEIDIKLYKKYMDFM